MKFIPNSGKNFRKLMKEVQLLNYEQLSKLEIIALQLQLIVFFYYIVDKQFILNITKVLTNSI